MDEKNSDDNQKASYSQPKNDQAPIAGSGSGRKHTTGTGRSEQSGICSKLISQDGFTNPFSRLDSFGELDYVKSRLRRSFSLVPASVQTIILQKKLPHGRGSEK